MPDNKTYNTENDEITVDFVKILHIIWYRKYVIVACYATIILLAVLITFIMPKKYFSEAKLLINKSNYTNLADINPFVVGNTPTDMAGGISSIISSGGGSSGLGDDLSILKSDEVLNAVIQANNLKYTKGDRAGQYLLPSDFAADKSLKIDTEKDGNVISISYKSPDRKLAYDIVNAFIYNFSKTYVRINTLKAARDNEFLENFYKDAKNTLEKKADALKEYQSSSEDNTLGSDIKVDNIYQLLLNQYDKRLKSQLKRIPSAEIENKKLEMDLEQEMTQLGLLKKKYEWSKLVKALSENASKLEILNQPVLASENAYSEPKLIINLLLALVISFTISFSIIVFLEKCDKKLVYSDLNDDASIFQDINFIDYSDLSIKINLLNINRISVLSFIAQNLTAELIQKLSTNLNPNIELNLIFVENFLTTVKLNDDTLNDILILATIGKTDRKIFHSFTKHLTNFKKNIIGIIALGN